MSESFSGSNSSDNTAEANPLIRLEAELTAKQKEVDTLARELFEALDELYDQKYVATRALQQLAISPIESDQREIGLADVESSLSQLPRATSDCLMYFFALESDTDRRLAFTSTILQIISPDKLDSARRFTKDIEPLYEASALEALYHNQPEASFVVEIERTSTTQTDIFLDNLYDYYDT